MKQHAIEVEHGGLMIRGMAYRPDAAGRCPTVLFLHGFTGQRIEAGFLFVRLARALAERGIAAVTFDFLHSGESDGSFERMMVSGELADTLHMLHWLQGQPFVDRSRVGLLGFSLGGLLASCAVARFKPIKALALLAPTTVHNLCRYARSPDCQPGQPVTLSVHRLHDGFFDDLRRLNPVADVIEQPRPTLLVQGSGDLAVTPAVSQAFVDAMERRGIPLAVVRIAEADHTFSQIPWQAQVIAATTDFFARSL